MNKPPPVLIIAFNRPDFCQQLIESLRDSRPDKVFFAVDGPRNDHNSDSSNCAETRKLVKLIDWKCEIKTLFHRTNKGCRKAPPEAITWFFKHVPAGVIMEDDCIPSPDFLQFASLLLEHYANNPKIGMISGNNHYEFQSDATASYHFSQHPTIWGWATWARSWKSYDPTMNTYRGQFDTIKSNLGHSDRFRNYWWRHVESVDNGLDSWAIQWAVTQLAKRQYTIRPRVNLVSNIGFNENSTHTSFDCDSDLFYSVNKIKFPLKHPKKITIDVKADNKMEENFTSFQHRLFNLIGAKAPITRKSLIWLNKVARKARI